MRPGRRALFEALLPRLRIDVRAEAPGRESLGRELFGREVSRLRLEIGFGDGERLAREAQGEPDAGFIGVEPFVNGMAKMLSRIDSLGLSNLRLFDEDAVRLLDWLPSASIQEAALLYPDPWPKKRHRKRRFFNRDNLDRLARILEPGGTLPFASDIPDYVNAALALGLSHPAFEWTARNPKDWKEPWPDWAGTRYEAKALREDRTPAYLTFLRKEWGSRGLAPLWGLSRGETP